MADGHRHWPFSMGNGMRMSYFARAHKEPNAVSIALSSPSWYKGRKYRALAPTWEMLNGYKEGKNEDIYIAAYQKILDGLDAQRVYDELGEDAILLCWEHPSRFCHRKLVAEWFKEKLGVTVKEL
jgi:hypothetical protein